MLYSYVFVTHSVVEGSNRGECRRWYLEASHYIHVNNAISRRMPHGQWPRRMHGRRTRGLHKTGRTGIASFTLVSDSSLHWWWKFTHPPHLSLITVISLAAGAVPYRLSFHSQSSDSSEPDGRGLRECSGCHLGEPLFKSKKIKIIQLYTYGYRSCQRTRSQASQGSLPTLIVLIV